MTTVHVPVPLDDDASRKLREALSGVVLPSAAAEAVRSWGPLVDDWLTAYDASPRTVAGYAREARVWSAWCESQGLDPLKAERRDVDRFAQERRRDPADPEKKGDSPRTLARRLAAISSLYAYAQSTDVVTRNPAKAVRRPKVNRRQSTSRALTAGEGGALLAAATADGPRSLALISLLLYQGLRVSEALSARIEHLGWDKGHRVLTITSKGGDEDKVPLAPPTHHAVEAVEDGRTEGLILCTSTGKPMDRRHAHRTVQRLAKAAGIKQWDDVGPHDLRHTAITGVLSSDAGLDAAQTFARHADPRTTKLYDHRVNDLNNHAAYKLTGFYQAPAK
ncbi:tyrosine-type recombinase/integrase [Streptantibioticus silvisoli]|uniref:Tyrosine-type recombinase/integrase n=1 Tax=Streptantibioticus silvisoli TaxID=2705255 RepID=A0ABT6W241_9ACTN|nr:tyrosine-type recombinase/integrase [Streptantibioticus silvisoli]MDI5964814.1 tyrosine-type recombinase/integrase [Streptantibioticus silvisoli]